jgi:hypothetical protein
MPYIQTDQFVSQHIWQRHEKSKFVTCHGINILLHAWLNICSYKLKAESKWWSYLVIAIPTARLCGVNDDQNEHPKIVHRHSSNHWLIHYTLISLDTVHCPRCTKYTHHWVASTPASRFSREPMDGNTANSQNIKYIKYTSDNGKCQNYTTPVAKM